MVSGNQDARGALKSALLRVFLFSALVIDRGREIHRRRVATREYFKTAGCRAIVHELFGLHIAAWSKSCCHSYLIT